MSPKFSLCYILKALNIENSIYYVTEIIVAPLLSVHRHKTVMLDGMGSHLVFSYIHCKSLGYYCILIKIKIKILQK